MNRHAQISRALGAGWTPVGDFGAATWFTFDTGARGTYQQMIVLAGERRVEISVSPTGRSVQVYVDGKKVEATS